MAVEVRAAAGGGRRGVRHLVGAGHHHADALDRHAQHAAGHHQHLGVQALAHLGAAVVELHAAVGVDVHQRAGLVVHRLVEGDAELYRRQRQAALALCVAGEDAARRGAPGSSCRQQLTQIRKMVGDHRLAVGVVLRSGLARTVEIAFAQLLRGRPSWRDTAIEDTSPPHPCGPPKTRKAVSRPGVLQMRPVSVRRARSRHVRGHGRASATRRQVANTAESESGDHEGGEQETSLETDPVAARGGALAGKVLSMLRGSFTRRDDRCAPRQGAMAANELAGFPCSEGAAMAARQTRDWRCRGTRPEICVSGGAGRGGTWSILGTTCAHLAWSRGRNDPAPQRTSPARRCGARASADRHAAAPRARGAGEERSAAIASRADCGSA